MRERKFEVVKDYYDRNYIRDIAGRIKEIDGDFDADGFAAHLGSRLADQAFTEKMCIIANGLHEFIPDYHRAIQIFTQMLGDKMASMKEMYIVGRPYAPFGKFIELFAVKYPEYFDETVGYVYELTQRYSGEFAMRPLLTAFPERTLAVLQEWAEDEHDCVRRLCTECMRVGLPWSKKITFALDHFAPYSDILVKLATDPNEYVRRSVANNLNEMCKADLDKAKVLIARLEMICDKKVDAVIKHGTRWARKKELLTLPVPK